MPSMAAIWRSMRSFIWSSWFAIFVWTSSFAILVAGELDLVLPGALGDSGKLEPKWLRFG